MTTEPLAAPTIEDLQEALRRVDPRARLLPSRLLRRIIRREQRLAFHGLHLAHRRSLTIRSARALAAATAEELGFPGGQEVPDVLFLIEEPDADDLAGLRRPEALRWAWRMLFHARIHGEFLDRGPVPGVASQRIAAIGTVPFEEAAAVLEGEGWLLAPKEEAVVYEEFVAVYLATKSFAEILLPTVFPAIDDLEAVDRTIAQDIDGNALFLATRPEGAADPGPAPELAELPSLEDSSASVEESIGRSERRYRRLLARADRARSRGNLVRSAILRTRAARLVSPSRAGQARGAAEDDLDRLAGRLKAALGPDVGEIRAWRPALSDLRSWADLGIWPVEAKLLFDLQKVCIDHEREVSAVDLLGWLVSLGKRAIRRPLPNQKLIRTARHLRAATARLMKARLGRDDRTALGAMLDAASQATETGLRRRIGPLIARALDRAGLRPANLPERVSLQKMTGEIEDLIVSRGFLTMGDVRDAISRSALRDPDLSSLGHLFQGDRVLRANRRLRVSLDGIYRPGEVYLRALQRMSLVAFGTRVGRWITRFVALPFGVAFGTLVTIHELLSLVRLHVHLVDVPNVLILGTFLLGVFYVRGFRSAVLAGLRSFGRVLRWLLIDGPAWLLDRPAMRRVLHSDTFDLFRRMALEPVAFAAGTAIIVRCFETDLRIVFGLALVAYFVVAAILNTRAGLEAEERTADAVVRGWRRFRSDFLPGVLRFINDVFGVFLDGVDRVLYTVDEWLRFRSGQGRLTFWAKAVLGVFWFLVTYLVRIYVNLLIEPQINPVKHFPTVTVAAKMIIPILKPLVKTIAAPLAFLGTYLSYGFAAFTVFFLPGAAGFIVWELKENWRLFEANRPKTLRPVPIGHHGETLGRLLRPGFHSGTIPRVFARLRKASRKTYQTGDARPWRAAREALHHVEEPLRHFGERELIALVEDARGPGMPPVEISEVHLATNRVRFSLKSAESEGSDLVVAFSLEGGRLIFDREADGWLSGLPEDDRATWIAALDGFSALAGAEFSRSRDGASPVLVPVRPISWSEWVARWSPAEARPAPPPLLIDSRISDV